MSEIVKILRGNLLILAKIGGYFSFFTIGVRPKIPVGTLKMIQGYILRIALIYISLSHFASELHQQNVAIDYDHHFILHHQSDRLLSEMIII